MLRVNTLLRSFSGRERGHIKKAALFSAVASAFSAYYSYRNYRAKDFNRMHANFRLSETPMNGTPVFHMFKTWYRMPWQDYQMYHRFKPYFVQGHIDYEKEILIPRTRWVNGRPVLGCDVYNPFYCFDDGRMHNVFPSFIFQRMQKKKKKPTKKKQIMSPDEDPSRTLRPSELKEYRQTFKVFDVNNDETITLDELENILRSMGQRPTREELVELMNEADLDGNGSIDEHEFLIMMANRKKDMNDEKQLQAAFKVFDKNGDGSISMEEMGTVMKSLGDEMSEKEIEDLIKEADEDGDGEINYDEFCKMMTSHRRTTRARFKRLSRVMAFSQLGDPPRLDPKRNFVSEAGAMVLCRGWIPWSMRDKLQRPHEVHRGRIVTVHGVFRPGKDIHDYKVPNNPYNGEWINVALEDFVNFWDLPNKVDSKFFYLQAVQIGDQANGMTPRDANGNQYQWPQPISVDDLIMDEYEQKISPEQQKYITYGISALSTFSAMLFWLA